jgi:hypothetical protein
MILKVLVADEREALPYDAAAVNMLVAARDGVGVDCDSRTHAGRGDRR